MGFNMDVGNYDPAAVCVKEIGEIRKEKPPFVSGSGVWDWSRAALVLVSP